jgi:hypothetical protein
VAGDRTLGGNYPLRALAASGRMSDGRHHAPRIELTVGRDAISGGLTIVGYLVNEDGWMAPSVLFAHRWTDAPQSLEECLQVAYRGLLAYFEESGILLP